MSVFAHTPAWMCMCTCIKRFMKGWAPRCSKGWSSGSRNPRDLYLLNIYILLNFFTLNIQHLYERKIKSNWSWEQKVTHSDIIHRIVSILSIFCCCYHWLPHGPHTLSSRPPKWHLSDPDPARLSFSSSLCLLLLLLRILRISLDPPRQSNITFLF